MVRMADGDYQYYFIGTILSFLLDTPARKFTVTVNGLGISFCYASCSGLTCSGGIDEIKSGVAIGSYLVHWASSFF